jgi:long-chain acyl-CoA synthetase
MGVGPGVHVGILMPNCPQFIISYYAILKAGGTVVNYNPLYSVPEICHQIEDSKTHIMMTLSLALLYPKVASALGKTNLKTIIVGDFDSALPCSKKFTFRLFRRKHIAKVPNDANHVRLEALLKKGSNFQQVAIHPESHIAVLQYTGGTTGVPKGAMLTHANLYINALQCGMWFTGLHYGKEKILAALPIFHVFAMTVNMNLAILTGSTILLHPRFDIKAILRDITRKRPTLMPGVPTMFAAFNNYPDIGTYDLTSLKMCFSGGGPLPQEVKAAFEKLSGCKLVEGYGLSETSPVASANPLFGVNKTGSIGIPLPATIIRIADIADATKTVVVGEIGEICIKGPQVMSGYFNQLEESAHVLKDNFLHTGDLGYMDEDGYVFVVDRLKEMIISGGYKVYPRNLEEILYQHPDILEAAVIGVHHPERVQATKVFVVRKKDRPLTEADVRTHLRGKISAYAMPHLVEFRDVLPKSAIGKILKKTLIEEESKKK